MEKLHSDMLEMILSQPIKRLNERQTKFLIYQVKFRFLFYFDLFETFFRYLLL